MKRNRTIFDAIILSSTYGESTQDLIEFIKHCCTHCQIAKKYFYVNPVLVFEKTEIDKYLLIKKYFENGFLEIFPNILIIKEGAGFSACLNFGIKETSSKYIIRIDTDDRFESNRITNQISEMEKNNLDICSGYMIDQNNHLMKYPLNNFALILMTSLGTNPIAHPSICMKREILYFFYNEDLNKCEDFDLWVRIFLNRKINFKCLTYPVTKYNTKRSYEKNKSNSFNQLIIRLKLSFKFIFFGIIMIIGIFPNLLRLIIPSNIILKIRRLF